MTDEQTDATDTTGTETNSTTEIPKDDTETKTPSQLLKEENDSLEKELIRQQKIRNEQLLAGDAGGKVDSKLKEESPKEYRDRIDKEIQEGKHND